MVSQANLSGLRPVFQVMSKPFKLGQFFQAIVVSVTTVSCHL